MYTHVYAEAPPRGPLHVDGGVRVAPNGRLPLTWPLLCCCKPSHQIRKSHPPKNAGTEVARFTEVAR